MNVDEAVTTEANASNDVEIDPKEEQNTQAYKDTMNIDIENINTFENRNKVYTTQWRTIYEVIEPVFFKKYDTFPDDFMIKCIDNANEYINIPIEAKIT